MTIALSARMPLTRASHMTKPNVREVGMLIPPKKDTHCKL